MLQCACAAGRDQGHFEPVGGLRDQLDVVAFHRAVTVDGAQHDFAGVGVLHAQRPLQRVEQGAVVAAARDHAQFAARLSPVVDAHHDALVTEARCGLRHEGGVLDRRGVDAHLVGPAGQQCRDFCQGPKAATHGERHEYFFRHALDDGTRGRPALRRGVDVHEQQFVHAVRVVHLGRGHRVARFAEVVVKAHALDQSAVANQELRDDSFLQHQGFQATQFSSIFRPLSWLFSGWNCAATRLPERTTAVTAPP